jgi:hypothetical protein
MNKTHEHITSITSARVILWHDSKHGTTKHIMVEAMEKSNHGHEQQVTYTWSVTSDGLAGHGLQRGRIGCNGVNSKVLHDPRIIRKLWGKKKKNNSSMEAHKHGDERERRSMRTYPRLEAEATTWRGSSRAAVAAASPGRTPMLHR